MRLMLNGMALGRNSCRGRRSATYSSRSCSICDFLKFRGLLHRALQYRNILLIQTSFTMRTAVTILRCGPCLFLSIKFWDASRRWALRGYTARVGGE